MDALIVNTLANKNVLLAFMVDVKNVGQSVGNWMNLTKFVMKFVVTYQWWAMNNVMMVI